MSQTKFIHIRNFNLEGDIDPRGGFTYAYRGLDSGVVYAIAQCSKQDNFRKAYGRSKAQGRLKSEAFASLFAGSEADFRNAVYDGVI